MSTSQHTILHTRQRIRPIRAGVSVVRWAVRVARGLIAAVGLAVLLAGIPWGLVHYVGWPLPDHIPRWPEIQAVLLSPMTTQFLLDLLACILWLLWAKFAWDVIACVPETLRGVRWPHRQPGLRPVGPLHALAGVLVGSVVLSLLGNRCSSTTTTAGPAIATMAHVDTIAAAPVTPGPTLHSRAPAQRQASTVDTPIPQASPGVVIVREPANGIYDSLWRIADRELHDGNRWPEIWALNKDSVMVDGRAFTNPNFIRPGWTLRLPTSAQPAPSHTAPAPQRPASATPDHDSTRPHALGAEAGTPTTAPGTPPSPTRHTPTSDSPGKAPVPSTQPHPGTGVTVSTGAYVGLGLAALITAAMVTVRFTRRRSYRAGSGKRDDLTIAPIVTALRHAHELATLPHDEDGMPIPPDPPEATSDQREVARRRRAQATARAVLPPPAETVLGIRDGHPVALDLARTRGLGLVGPGATAAARALLVTLLAQAEDPSAHGAEGGVEILVPVPDARSVLGEDVVLDHPPVRLRLVAGLGAALDMLEVELVTRTRHTREPAGEDPPAAVLVLVASPAPYAERRLQAILDNGSALGLAGVLIGQWRPGGTVRVHADGTVGAASPNLADTLLGTRLFTLPPSDTSALLDLLGDAEPPREDHPAYTDRRRRESDPDQLEILAEPSTDHASEEPSTPAPTSRPRVTIAVPSDEPPASPPPGEHERTPPSGGDTVAHFRSGSGGQVRSGPGEPASAASAGVLGTAPRDTVADGDDVAPRPLELLVLGRLRLIHHPTGDARDVTEALARKQREILTYLALHRDGARRDALTAALWPDAVGDQPRNNFHATLSQMRRVLRDSDQELGGIAASHDGHYALNPELVSVDLWELQSALHDHWQARGEHQRVTALRRVADLHHGDLAEGLDADWLEAPREALRRDILDALSALVRVLEDDAPEHMLTVLEQTRQLDRYNEAIYCDIVRAQARLGRHDAISRTLSLLRTTLAELDRQPSHDTIALCEFLQRPHTTPHARSDTAS